ncbi:hypothetical protein Tsubulata_029220, partial [Turnera subulata]
LELTLRQVVRFIEYPLKYKRNVNNLKKKVGELKREHDKLQRYTEDERRNLKSIESEVEEWLSDVDKTIQKLEAKLAAREERAKRKCFIGLCPNVKARYQLSRKAKKETEAIDHLHKKRDRFSKIAYETPLVEAISVKGYEAFDSRIAAFKELTDALVDSENFNTIGVYGMGGIGKTTLVKEVARKAEVEKLFDKVIFATVTRTADIKKIQTSIAEKLVLPLNETSSEERRASRLRERLKKEKKILIVLDDLSEALDLEAVGIPSQNDHKGCKILLTSESRNILSRALSCQKLVSLDLLKEDEAWYLFRKIAGDTSWNPELHSVAFKVANKCEGLPLLISVVAKSLKNETNLSVWKDTLRRLEIPSPRNFTGVPAEGYAALKLSIDRLPSEELKSTFLLCCRLGNYGLFVDLLKYGIGLSLFSDAFTVEAARDRLESLLDHLRASSLLPETDGREYFTMHGVLRHVGLSIASSDGNVLVRDEEDELREWPDKEKLKGLTAIHLSCSIIVLPDELECPKLQFLCISPTDSQLKIPDNLFRKMHKLKVLDLTRFSLLSLPSSLVSLKLLRTLSLDHSKLPDLSIIGELKNLEILSFSGSMFKHFPRALGQLTKLKLLDLTDCFDLKVIPPNVISKLSQLEELLMQNSFDGWENEGQNAASLVELNHLPRLTNLEIRIRDVRTMPKEFPAEKLQRYRILIGSSWDWDGSFETSKMLKLKLDTDIRNNESYGICNLIKKAEALYMDEVKGVENLLYDLDREARLLFKHLHLQNNSEIKYIVNRVDGASSDTVFPMLKTLFLHNLVSLEKIFHGKFMAQLFGKLEILEVSDCIKLKNLFSLPLVKGLVKLQSIKVTSCDNMVEIIVEESEECATENGEAVKVEFSQLRSISLSSLPLLQNFYSKVKAQVPTASQSQEIIEEEGLTSIPTTLFNDKVVFPNLEHLYLESIDIEKIWDGQPSNSALSLRNLRTLEVKGCGLKYLFSASMVKSLERLECLQVSECELMEEIIVIGGSPTEDNMSAMVFPKLEILELCDLPKLSRFSTGYPIECPSLDQLTISACPKLKTFVSSFTSGSTANIKDNHYDAIQPLFDENVAFPELTTLEVDWYHMMQISQSQAWAEIYGKIVHLELRHFPDEYVVFPSNFLQRFFNLEILVVTDASFEEIFPHEQSNREKMDIEFLPKLKELELNGLSKLQFLSKEDSHPCPLFQNLETLVLFECVQLKLLIPSSVSFRNLTDLDVTECHGLVRLMTCSAAHRLVNLKRMSIEKCKMIQEIVATEENRADVEVIFHKLEILTLDELPSLACFHSRKCSLIFPSLCVVLVKECPKMNFFSAGHISTPKLEAVDLTEEGDRWSWEGNLNETIRELFTQTVRIIDSFSSVFKLQNFHHSFLFRHAFKVAKFSQFVS